MAGHVVKVSVVADTKNFSRAFKGLAKETGLSGLAEAGKTAVTTLATVAAAGAAAIGVAGAKAVSAAADLEQSTGAIKAVFSVLILKSYLPCFELPFPPSFSNPRFPSG